jgi:dihydroorotase
VIDPHTHIRDLEQAYKEDWRSGSEAALNGGVTMVFDMPNSIPSTTSLRNLNLKRKVAEKSRVQAQFYLGATNTNAKTLRKILEETPLDVVGIKMFLSASSDNEIMDNVSSMRKIFELAEEFDQVLTVHTEVQKFIAPKYKFPQKIEYHNTIRDRKAAQVTTKEEVELIRNSKFLGEKVFCEVTPHHLLLNEEICGEMGNLAKMNPPLRTKEDNEALWEGINNYTIDMIASDHAPHSLREKRHAYSTAPSGIPGLDTTLRLMLTCVKEGRLSKERLQDLVSTKAAYIFNREEHGKITENNSANITIIDPEKKGIIRGRRNRSKARFTPFEGFHYTGSPVFTIANGKLYEIIR